MNLIAKTLESPGRTLRAFGSQLLSAAGHRDYTRFIVLSRSRTGSNFLLSLLNSHPNVVADWEIFARLSGRAHDDILAKAYGRQPRHVRAKGFKLFYYHPLDDDSGALWRDLVASEDIRVIHLKRQNILRTLISRKIAGQQDVWASTTAEFAEPPGCKAVSFTVDELEAGFIETRRWEQRSDSDFSAHQLITVTYESLTSAPERALQRVLEFLDQPYQPLTTHMKKQNPEPLSELVTNYAELKRAFANTQWQRFFEE